MSELLTQSVTWIVATVHEWEPVDGDFAIATYEEVARLEERLVGSGPLPPASCYSHIWRPFCT